jgi:tRNA(Arg) A34 adenosine deaminase TadA
VGAVEAWAALDLAWQVALDEAWISWRTGSRGIGAAVVDDRGEVVSRGRNRLADEVTEPGVLAGSNLAHAEMNALAALPRWSYEGHELYTTREPCLMCASTCVLLRIPVVHFAALDPVFEDAHDHLGRFPFCADRLPRRHGPLDGPVGAFAAVLPMLFNVTTVNWVVAVNREHSPRVVALAEAVVADARLCAVADGGGGAAHALAVLWDDLVAVSSASPPHARR